MKKAEIELQAANLVLLVNKYGLSTEEALKLQQTARFLHRLHIAAVKYEITDRQETRQYNLYKKAADVFPHFIREQRDPANWPLDISLEPHSDTTQYDHVCPF